MLPEHVTYMNMALDLARKGEGLTTPNPVVGALLVRDAQVVGQGFHQKSGEDHAEIIALKEAGEKSRGATLYITLEPCCHVGKTGPCTEAIWKAGVRKVVVGMLDPNELVNGKGIRELRRLGVEVETGVLEKECQDLNEFFTFWIKHQTPFVMLKVASTLDGKIATFKGESQWITSEESRNVVQSLRNKVDAIIVGIGTVMTDNPQLLIENKNRPNPLRIIVDSKLKISPRAKVLKVDERTPTMVVTTRKSTQKKMKALERKGVRVVVVPDKRGRVSIVSLLKLLGKEGVLSVLVEGGAELNASFLREKLAHKMYNFIAPRILGDDALGAFADMGLGDLDQAIKIKNTRVQSIGKDFLIQGYF